MKKKLYKYSQSFTPRASLDYVAKRKLLPLPSIKPQLESPQLTELSRLITKINNIVLLCVNSVSTIYSKRSPFDDDIFWL
jgi:hypothetical protein